MSAHLRPARKDRARLEDRVDAAGSPLPGPALTRTNLSARVDSPGSPAIHSASWYRSFKVILKRGAELVMGLRTAVNHTHHCTAVFVVYASKPSKPPSPPMPDCLCPPTGNTPSEGPPSGLPWHRAAVDDIAYFALEDCSPLQPVHTVTRSDSASFSGHCISSNTFPSGSRP
jgi:hypothetical protein